MLRPSRPMIRPFIVVRKMDDGHGVLRGVVRGHPLHRGEDDVAGLVRGLLAGASLDRAGELDGVAFGLLADRLEDIPLASSAERLLTVSRAAIRSWLSFSSSCGPCRARSASPGACGPPRACRSAGRARHRGHGAPLQLVSSPRRARASSSTSRWRRIFSSLARGSGPSAGSGHPRRCERPSRGQP